MSIRFKIILPFMLLTLFVAVTGAYVVTRLVANSLEERLSNQLLEAGRVASDIMTQQEIDHLQDARLVAYTRGIGEGLKSGNAEQIASLAKPAAGGLKVESLFLYDSQGVEIFHSIKKIDGAIQDVTLDDSLPQLSIVNELLSEKNPESLPRRILTTDPIDGRFYYFTAIPVVFEDRVVGVVVVATTLDTILPILKSTSFADVIFYGKGGNAIATTLKPQSGEGKPFLQEISLPLETYQNVIESDGFIMGENISVGERSYSTVRSKLQVDNELLGVIAMALPNDYVVQTNATSRNSFTLLYSIAMFGVIIIGYFVARVIIDPLSTLLKASRAIASGDLTQRTKIKTQDEIGVLSNTFDEMTEYLQQRTIELERTNRVLEQIDRSKTRFVTVTAHELRTPLTISVGYLQMLKGVVSGNEEAETIVQTLLDNSYRMNEALQDMLDVSLIDSDSLSLQRSKIQIEPIFQKAYLGFEYAIAERKIKFNVEGLSSLPVVLADPDLLRKAFYHLISNAIKFTPDGGRIYVTGRVITSHDASIGYIEIAIRDTGIGIEPEYHELIFEKFYQTGNISLLSTVKTTFKGGGPGLGLALVRGIMDAHHGRVWVESSGHDEEKYPGSTFYIRLPLTDDKS